MQNGHSKVLGGGADRPFNVRVCPGSKSPEQTQTLWSSPSQRYQPAHQHTQIPAQLSCIHISYLSLWHIWVFFRKWFSKATFERKLSDVAYTLAQAKVNFHKQNEFNSWEFSFAYILSLWLVSQKHVTLLTEFMEAILYMTTESVILV